MKFLAVFVTLAAVAYGFPSTTTWTLNELSNALQSPGTDPVLIPYLEAALNEMMNALHHGHNMETITIAMPIVADYTLQEVNALLQDPTTPAAHIPYLENALNQLMDAIWAGAEKPVATVVLPPAEKPEFVDIWPVQTPEEKPEFVDIWPVQKPEEKPEFVDVWPVQTPEEEPSFVDVWPIQNPESVSPAVPVAPAAPSSPLVQIIVNVNGQQVSTATAEDASIYEHAIERPTPAIVEDPLPGWGNFIEPQH